MRSNEKQRWALRSTKKQRYAEDINQSILNERQKKVIGNARRAKQDCEYFSTEKQMFSNQIISEYISMFRKVRHIVLKNFLVL